MFILYVYLKISDISDIYIYIRSNKRAKDTIKEGKGCGMGEIRPEVLK